MTKTARKIIGELQRVLEQLPEEEQEARASSYLADARHRQKRADQKERYSFFKVLMDGDTDLDLPSDYSETYEEHLYGISKRDD